MNDAIKLAIEALEAIANDINDLLANDGKSPLHTETTLKARAALAALRAPLAKLYTQDDLNREFDEGANRQAEIWKSRLDMERQRTKHIEEMNRTLLEHLAKMESLTKPPPMILMGAQPDHSELIAKIDRQERVMREALEYATFCWRDVPMNDYAVERTDALIAAIEKELGE